MRVTSKWVPQRAVRGERRSSRWRGIAVAVGLMAAALPLTIREIAPATVEAAALSATDESVVPHYFGPYSNYANSAQALVNAIVTVTGGGGSGAEAAATVDPKTGGISSIDVTSPGTGYTSAPSVVISSPGITPTAAASATATLSTGVITSVTVAEQGFGFTNPVVTLTDTSATPGSGATAVASGGVDSLTLVNGGSGYVDKPVVKIGLPNLDGGVQATGVATMDADGVVDSIAIVEPGSGYTSAPTVEIWDALNPNNAGPATVTATINVSKVDVTDGGADYIEAPTVSVLDANEPFERGATATAAVAALGAVSAITVDQPGAGYITPGIKKFKDTLPGLGEASANNQGNYIPVGVPDTTTYPGTDYYEIAVVQYYHSYGSDIPATLSRGYVQLSTGVVPGKHVALTNASLDSSQPGTPVTLPNGDQAYGFDVPHYLGPTIVATKNRPVRILFRNLLPTGADGDLFLPVDTSVMGAGYGPNSMMLDANGVPMDMAADQGSVLDGVRNPVCGMSPKPGTCYTDNRAELHLHGGITPWISDGTPHQWVTPANENTAYPKGVSVSNVPDMADPGPGAETFFYTNQQSARLMFYHDHAWGITRLNVYAGEAAGYMITDEVEQSLFGATGTFKELGLGTPLIVQDKTFVPGADQLAKSDPTWNTSRWGAEGSLWTPHVYMPAQNPSDPTGMNPFGRWHYGPWFWPPATDTKNGPIANPYFDSSCDPETAVDGFCEPQQIPGTPNVSVGMEAFNDTPIVNGTAYPTTTVDPKAYRYRILNAANDRVWNLQWYVADPTTGTLSEVALNKAEVEAAQSDPNVFPTPDTSVSPVGPSWVQIGSEGGFLPQPTVVPNQPITWITDATRFDVGNVDQHSLLLAPAERADVIVDFSQYRGKTLILYNDAPAAFPARVSSYDYYTGGPDLWPAGAHSTLPGYGPNTRTIMQVKVSDAAPAVAFDRPNTTTDKMGQLMAAFAHHLDANGKPAGVFEKGQNPIIVGQAAYNSTYGTNFASAGWCNSPTRPTAKCDGAARIGEQAGQMFKFDTLNGKQISVKIESKAIHDETNSNTFDEFGRSTATLGVESKGITPLTQNINLYPYVNPATEVLYSDNLPSSLDVTPISTGDDGTQIWKITHNGVDTHPIHFHLFDVQVLNRVTWDGINIPTEPSELGWKDTVRISPLQDTIVAVRPIIPTLPFNIPDSRRPLNPMMPIGAKGDQAGPNGKQAGFNNTDVQGNPIDPIVNEVVNFGWEYVYHCHILSHEEMDMMRPVSVHVTSIQPAVSTLTAARDANDPTHVALQWNDRTPVNYSDPTTWGSRAAEIGYRIERATVTWRGHTAYEQVGLGIANSTSYTDTTAEADGVYLYRVTAWNEGGVASSAPKAVLGGVASATSVTVTSDANPSVVTDRVTFTATVSTSLATGNVVFSVDGVSASPVAVADGVATFSTTSLTKGTHTVVATYAGDANFLGSVSDSFTQTVKGFPTTVNLQSSRNPSPEGMAVTFTAIVQDVRQTNGAPTGSVRFTVTGPTSVVTTSTVVLSGSGAATYSTSSLLVGDSTVVADYLPTGSFDGSTATLTQTTTLRPTTTAVTSNREPSNYGQSVSLTATIRAAGGATGTPTGTVQFTITNPVGVPTVATVTVNGTGLAVYTSTALSPGVHTVTALYQPTGMFAGSSGSLVQTIIGRPTISTVTSNRNPSTFGQSVTLTAAVRTVAANNGTPTGTVVFTITNPNGVNTVATANLNNQGNAVYTSTVLSVGTHRVTTQYVPSGTLGFEPSTGTITQIVNRATSTTAVSANSTNPRRGQSVTITATINPTSGTGTVQFRLNGANLGAPVAVAANGRAALTTTTLPVGRLSITAVYSGDANVTGSTSNALTVTVR